MAKPNANTEGGGAKVLPLADTTAATPVPANPVAPVKSVSGDATYGNLGWLGIATHGDGDGALAPGAGISAPKDSAGVAKAPIVLGGGMDNAGTKLAHAFRTDENGVQLVSERGALDLPLLTPGGAVTISAVTETALTSVDVARFGYLRQLEAICTVASTTAGTWTIKDGAAGTTLLVLQQPITTAAVGTRYIWTFPKPWKTNAINKAFTVTYSAATIGTWVWIANGFLSTL